MSETFPGNNAELVSLAFQLAPSGVIVAGADGAILLANREADRMFGFEPGGMVGQPVERFVPAAARDGHAALRERFLAAPVERPMGAGRDLFAVRRDGTEFPVEVGLNPVTRAGRTIVIATVVDIGERLAARRREREHEEQVRQMQKVESLGTLAGGIAHDFNNILLGIMGYAELAQRAVSDRGVSEDLAQVLAAAERGRLLVRRILTFARRGEEKHAPLDPGAVVREAAGLLRASLPASVEMRVMIEPGLPAVRAEATLLHQVVLNLGTNGAHAMEAGGVLEIELVSREASPEFAAAHAGLRPGPGVRLAVRDHGAGMPPEVRERLFEPFFSTKPAGQGTGIGMSVVLGIVRTLDGAIDVESAPGAGTTVAIWLPAERTAELRTVQVRDAGAGPPALHAMLVEDEPALAAMESRQLAALGYRVTAHTSSMQALEDFRARPERFDVVVTDNSMPRMTGLALARELSALRPGQPILMVSGYADGADAEVLRAHGVTAVLRKPHTAAELGAALAAILPRS